MAAARISGKPPFGVWMDWRRPDGRGTKNALLRDVRFHCPRCASVHIRPDACRWYERLLIFLLLSPFRCRRCCARFIRFASIPNTSRLFAASW